MRRITHCTACNNEKYGVKTRVAIPHTCGKEFDPKKPLRKTVDYIKSIIETLAEGSIIKLAGDKRHEYFVREHFKDKWSMKTKIVSIGTKDIKWIDFGTEVNYTGKNFYNGQ